MQQRNLVIFILLTIVILFGWTALQQRLWPPRPRTQEPWEALSLEERREAGARLSLVAVHGAGGLGGAADVATQAVVADLWARDKLPPEVHQEKKPRPAPLAMVALP